MAMTAKEIKALARLARLDFSDEKCEEFCGEFDEIIAFADRINSEVEGDTSSVKAHGDTIGYGELRDDEVGDSLTQDEVLSNVGGERGYFTVRRVVK